MRRLGDDIVKIGVMVKSASDCLRLIRASKSCKGYEKIIVGMGHYGIYTRILAERFDSFLTYSSALSEKETPGAAGQLDIKDLAELYRFRKITKKTNLYGIIGNPLKISISPWFFNTVFALENTDAVYVPFPINSVNDFLNLADELDVKGFSITVPFKESILYELEKSSANVQSIGACNTIKLSGNEWYGENTDCTGFSDSLLTFINKKNLKGKKITIIGAGGVARAVAAEVYRLGGKALILNRTIHKARNIALLYKFRWAGLDSQGIELMSKHNDIIIQTTSMGMEGYDEIDPVELYSFTGKEAVMDLIYMPDQTAFLKRAIDAGCKTINGYDMVIRQACLQYSIFTGREIPKQLLSRIINPGANEWNKIRTG
jgi:3-dehydroquinate dehydratase/shikimate dehydrogenase